MKRATIEQRKRFASDLATRDARKRESWQRPDPRRYYRFWRERFTADEIRSMAEAIWGAP